MRKTIASAVKLRGSQAAVNPFSPFVCSGNCRVAIGRPGDHLVGRTVGARGTCCGITCRRRPMMCCSSWPNLWPKWSCVGGARQVRGRDWGAIVQSLPADAVRAGGEFAPVERQGLPTWSIRGAGCPIHGLSIALFSVLCRVTRSARIKKNPSNSTGWSICDREMKKMESNG